MDRPSLSFLLLCSILYDVLIVLIVIGIILVVFAV
jgi:hypothetical protein